MNLAVAQRSACPSTRRYVTLESLLTAATKSQQIP
jgi:hypothetical protein